MENIEKLMISEEEFRRIDRGGKPMKQTNKSHEMIEGFANGTGSIDEILSGIKCTKDATFGFRQRIKPQWKKMDIIEVSEPGFIYRKDSNGGWFKMPEKIGNAEMYIYYKRSKGETK